jgi:hypothetical protein
VFKIFPITVFQWILLQIPGDPFAEPLGLRYDSPMGSKDNMNISHGMTLCKSCGLCCTGHFFIWSKLRSAELDPIESLGLKVFREPERRGFNQPCPLWQGQCTIYDSPHYPRFCHTYKCKLLKKLLNENIQLPEALIIVDQAKEMIEKLEYLLPISTNDNFRERLVNHIERGKANKDFQQKANALLLFLDTQFDINDFFDSQ